MTRYEVLADTLRQFTPHNMLEGCEPETHRWAVVIRTGAGMRWLYTADDERVAEVRTTVRYGDDEVEAIIDLDSGGLHVPLVVWPLAKCSWLSCQQPARLGGMMHRDGRLCPDHERSMRDAMADVVDEIGTAP